MHYKEKIWRLVGASVCRLEFMVSNPVGGTVLVRLIGSDVMVVTRSNEDETEHVGLTLMVDNGPAIFIHFPVDGVLEPVLSGSGQSLVLGDWKFHILLSEGVATNLKLVIDN